MVIANVSIEPEVCRVLCDTLNQLPITAAKVLKRCRIIHLHRTGWSSKCQTGESLSVVNGCLLFFRKSSCPGEAPNVRLEAISHWASGNKPNEIMGSQLRVLVWNGQRIRGNGSLMHVHWHQLNCVVQT